MRKLALLLAALLALSCFAAFAEVEGRASTIRSTRW